MQVLENEQGLIRAIQENNDKQALSGLYNFYLPIIYGYCIKRIGNKEEAEEVTSEVFLKMVRQIENFRGESSFKNWLFAIVKNTLADKWRASYNLKTVSLESFMEVSDVNLRIHTNDTNDTNDDNDDDDDDDKYEEEMQKLKNVVKELPKKYMRVLELRFFERMSLKETAKAMGVKSNYVKVLQYRAVKRATEIARSA